MTKQQKLEKLLRGCSKCVYEEADGGLYRHCPACQFEITKLTYEIVIDDRRELCHKDKAFDNGLTPAEEEMFQIAEEECAELIQAISKVRRFGSNRKAVPGHTDADRDLYQHDLVEEAGDVIACIAVLAHNGLIDIQRVNAGARFKLDRIKDPATKRVHFITPEMVP